VGAGALTASPDTQFLAPYLAAASAAVWVAMLVWFLVANRSEIRSGVRKLGSWYFILPCIALAILAVAGAAYGLGIRSLPPSDEATSKVNQRVVRPTAANSLVSPERFYSRAEKERIVDTMNSIQQGFANIGRKMMLDAAKISSNPGQNEELDKSIEKMRAVHSEGEQLSGVLEKIRNESQSYPVDFAVLLAAKPVYFDEFQRAVYDYSNALSAYRHFLSDSGEHKGTLAKVVDSSKRHLSRAQHFLGKWMDECDEQMREARRLLEK